MSVHSRHRAVWQAAKLRRILREAGDSREFVIREQPDDRYPGEPFVLLAGESVGTDVPVGRDGWPGFDVGAQDVHGSDEAA